MVTAPNTITIQQKTLNQTHNKYGLVVNMQFVAPRNANIQRGIAECNIPIPRGKTLNIHREWTRQYLHYYICLLGCLRGLCGFFSYCHYVLNVIILFIASHP